MSEDPKLFDAGDYNLFRYCHNDPLDLTDPMGLGIDNPPPPVAQWLQSVTKQVQQFQTRMADLAERAQSTSEAEHTWLGTARIGQGVVQASQQLARGMADAAGAFAQRFVGGRDRGTHYAGATHVGDSQIYGELGSTYNRVSAANIPRMSLVQFLTYQNKNNTDAFYNAKWYYYGGGLAPLSGKVWFGHEINNMAIGEGFAARGWSTGAMSELILGRRYAMMPWNAIHGIDPGGIMGGEVPWALVGYSYYQIRSGGE
jgi:hypothetical protein